MAETRPVESLQISQDLEFERRQWRAQHVGWVVILLLLVAGLLGVFGGGLLSGAEATSGSLTLEYERLVRQRAQTALHLRLTSGPSNGIVSVWIDQPFLESVDVERITPQPVEMAAGAGRIVYHIALEDPSQPAEITVTYQPVGPGLRRIALGVVDGADLGVAQFVYP